MKKNITFEEYFSFLESKPEFYEKVVENDVITYFFYVQDDPEKSLGMIKIPLIGFNNQEYINWNFLSLVEGCGKPVNQLNSAYLYHTPDWFKSLVLEIEKVFHKIIKIFRVFN